MKSTVLPPLGSRAAGPAPRAAQEGASKRGPMGSRDLRVMERAAKNGTSPREMMILPAKKCILSRFEPEKW